MLRRRWSKDRSLNQLINVTTLPGVQQYVVVMPDVHEGYGFPIGAVAATDLEEGVISPGGIGYDINCGVRLMKSDMDYDSVRSRMQNITNELFQNVPSGIGKRGHIRLSSDYLDRVLEQGCRWAEARGYTEGDDLLNTESGGCLEQADNRLVSQEARQRGYDQLGTMGGGNHFLEIGIVDKIYDEKAASAFGLSVNQITIMLHTGSRGLGHQIATDYIRKMVTGAQAFNINLPDRELSCAPITSAEGQKYFSAMCAAANFAWTNRQIINYYVRQSWRKIFGDGSKLDLLYDVAHNIAKIEEHTIDGQKKKVLVHRKGATRAFPPGHADVTEKYREIGQPVLIPGSMGTSSYVLAGAENSMKYSFGSACHGAGRMLSRTAAKKSINSSQLLKQLNDDGILISTASIRGLAEEAPDAYKDIDMVVDVVESTGIARKVARLKPLAVIKG